MLFVCVVVCFIIAVHGVSIWKYHMSLSYSLVLIAGEMLRNAISTSCHFSEAIYRKQAFFGVSGATKLIILNILYVSSGLKIWQGIGEKSDY